jgi:hypothetical protein
MFENNPVEILWKDFFKDVLAKRELPEAVLNEFKTCFFAGAMAGAVVVDQHNLEALVAACEEWARWKDGRQN